MIVKFCNDFSFFKEGNLGVELSVVSLEFGEMLSSCVMFVCELCNLVCSCMILLLRLESLRLV